MKYFNQNDITQYYNYAISNNKEEKDKIYNKYLYHIIDKQVSSIIKQNNFSRNNYIMNNYEDIKQELHIHILIKVLPYIDITKVQGLPNRIYISIKNCLINMLMSNESRSNLKYDMSFNLNDNDVVEYDDDLNADEIVRLINIKIDEKINDNSIANSYNSVYLQLLKE